MPQEYTESELLELARKFSFRSRIDKNVVTGPIMVWGRGSVVRDVNGKEYLDFNSGQMCAALGHNHPRIVQALQESGETLIHSHMSMFNDQEIILAARLAEISPEGMNRSMFLTSGSDSNEAAMAIAKRYTGGYEFASPAVSFHGMNDSTRAVTFSGWHEGYGPYAPGHYPIIAPYRYRCRFCQDRPACDYSCLDTSFELLDAQADGPLAGIITEPLFSAGGVIDLPAGWLAELKRRCEAGARCSSWTRPRRAWPSWGLCGPSSRREWFPTYSPSPSTSAAEWPSARRLRLMKSKKRHPRRVWWLATPTPTTPCPATRP